MFNIRKQLSKLYLSSVLGNLSLTGAWVAILAARGFSLVEIGIAETVFHITSIIFELPSGVMADVFGRKKMLIVSTIMQILGSIAMIASNDLFMVCVAIALHALCYNFSSGTGDALAYDSMKKARIQSKFEKYESNQLVIYRVCSGISTLCAGLALAIGYRLAYGTELITDFKTFSDGRLWAGSVDMRESHEHAGHFFRRETDGTWTNLTSCISGHNGVTANYAAHIWDIAEFGGKFFTAGYGICASSNWGDTRMTDATPDLSSGYRTYFESATSVWIAGKNRFNVGQARKFAAFMPFDDDLFCFSMDFGYKYYMDIFEWEEWRWDASLGKFVSSLVPWSDFAPGITEEDKAITVSPDMSDYLEFDIRPSHCRRFGSRVLYLIEGIKTNVASHSRPWAAYSAVNQNHHVKATKIDLGGARPFDIHVSGDVAYIVAAKGTEMGTVVTNSVWKTEDGVTFTELFHFATNRHATALCKYGDDFYVGMGYSTNVCYIWKNLPKDPELSGNIYRIRFDDGNQGGGQDGDVPQPPVPSDVAWFSYEAATGATSGGTWDGEASSFALSEPLTIDHVGTITMQLRVKSAAEFPVAEPDGIASFAFRRDDDAPSPWEWTSRGWQRLYGLSVAEGQAVSLVATVGNGKVSYSIDGVALTNSAGRSVFSTHGVGFSSLGFSFPSVGNFSGTLREERMKRFWMTLR